jgi:hypothetical protein
MPFGSAHLDAPIEVPGIDDEERIAEQTSTASV